MAEEKPAPGATPALTGPTHGQQGVDKAPGEEESTDTLQFEQLSQKGKKNDGDPELEEDKPADQSDLPDTKTEQ